MVKKGAIIPLIGIMISLIILLFGNNILGRFFSESDNAFESKQNTDSNLETINSNRNIHLDSLLNIKSDTVLKDDIVEEIVIDNKIIDDLLENIYSVLFDELIENKEFERALKVIENAKNKTVQPFLLERLDNRRRAILLTIEKEFDNTWFNFPSKLILTKKDNKYGLYSRSGKEVINPIFDDIDPTVLEYLLVTKKNGKYGFINEDGNEIFKPIFSSIEPFYFAPLIVVEEHGKHGFINDKGEIIIELVYSNIINLDNNMIQVEKNGKYGFINFEGEEVIDVKFDEIHEFGEDEIVRAKLNGKNVFVDKKGNLVENLAFQ